MFLACQWCDKKDCSIFSFPVVLTVWLILLLKKRNKINNNSCHYLTLARLAIRFLDKWVRRFQSYLKHCHYMMRKYLYDTLLMEFTQSTYKIRGCTTSGIHIWNNSTCWLSFFNLKYGTISTIHHYTAANENSSQYPSLQCLFWYILLDCPQKPLHLPLNLEKKTI